MLMSPYMSPYVYNLQEENTLNLHKHSNDVHKHNGPTMVWIESLTAGSLYRVSAILGAGNKWYDFPTQWTKMPDSVHRQVILHTALTDSHYQTASMMEVRKQKQGKVKKVLCARFLLRCSYWCCSSALGRSSLQQWWLWERRKEWTGSPPQIGQWIFTKQGYGLLNNLYNAINRNLG